MSPLLTPRNHLFVVTMDGRASRAESSDSVEREARRLNDAYGDRLALPFDRTVGDEMQAATRDASWLVDLVLDVVWGGEWWVGIGYGRQDAPLQPTARESRGEPFYRARDAVEAAKRSAWGFALHGPPSFDAVSECLVLLSWIVRRRTDRQQEAAHLFRALGRTTDVARELGLQASSVTERLQGAGVVEEETGRRLAARLLATAMEGPPP